MTLEELYLKRDKLQAELKEVSQQIREKKHLEITVIIRSKRSNHYLTKNSQYIDWWVNSFICTDSPFKVYKVVNREEKLIYEYEHIDIDRELYLYPKKKYKEHSPEFNSYVKEQCKKIKELL